MNNNKYESEPYVEIMTIPSSSFSDDQIRLDAAHYSKARPETIRLLVNSGYALKPLKDWCQSIFNLARFKRVYATNPGDGWPYMTPGRLVMFRCHEGPHRFLSKTRAPKNAKKYFVKEDWVLITCSGTVGRALLATKSLEKYFFTHDLIRIEPKPGVKTGYLTAFFSSNIGQTLIKDEYGGTIDHIEPVHIENLPIPNIPEETQTKIHSMVKEAYVLRDKANYLLNEAEKLVESTILKNIPGEN